jgi:hypothetical protein
MYRQMLSYEIVSTMLAKSPEPTAVGALSSAVAVHVARRRTSFLRMLRFLFVNR